MKAIDRMNRLWGKRGTAMPRLMRSGGILVLLICLASPALADINAYNGEFGSVVLSGFLELETDIHTAHPNPANNPQSGNPEVQLFRQWVLLDTNWQTPVEGLRVYARTRFFADNTANINAADIPHYDAFHYRFPGDGAAMMTVANDNVALEGWEEWVQYENPNWFFRVGKQTIVWGDVAPTRLLDEANPLDVSWHVVGEPLGRDVFDNLRIPIWAARASYTLPFLPDFQIEGYVTPDVFAFMDLQTADQGSPVAVVPRSPGPSFPPFVNIQDNVKDGRHGASGGVRLVGLLGGVNFTLAWFTRHDPDYITAFHSFTFVPVLPPTIPPFVHGILNVQFQHPRFQTIGGSYNYFNDWTGAVLRGEGVWDIGRPWQDGDTLPAAVSPIILHRDRWGYVLAVDRPTFFIQDQHHSTSLTLQWEQLWNEKGAHQIAFLNEPVDQHQEEISFLFEQPVEGFDWRGWNGRYDEWYFDFTLLASLENSAAVVPLVRYEPGDHWRFATWYNLYLGPGNEPAQDATIGGFGALTWQNGVNIAISYLF
jgi:Protein of unknown function (DUF1302)